ncbi:MAG TPA: acetoacetate--CoA ligase [Acidimicrobiales bacterium]|nr:acetoacetate--CoA ligase [Acidimicrobiales bacterium]
MTTPLWTPSPERARRSQLHALLEARGFATYDEAWAWSTDPATLGEFWTHVADDTSLQFHSPASVALVRDRAAVTGARWFPGATLNYAEHALRRRGPQTAVISHDDARDDREVSWDELAGLVGGLQRGLAARGVGRGDVVAAYLPNVVETLALMLAVTGLGATWTCCAPETGVDGVLDRLLQTAPSVFVAVDGYRYGERTRDSREDATAVLAGLASVRHAVMLDLLALERPTGFAAWSELAGDPAEPTFEPVPFDHPLYVLYSSGTTGKPKAIVHGHGGILLEHAKALRYHFDIDGDDRFFWYTTTGWMMWNFCVSGLVVGATVALFDGNPSAPRADRLWAFIDDHAITVAGVGAAYLVAGAKAGLVPRAHYALDALETLGATGSPLPGSAAEWVYRDVKDDLLVASFSGGTDVCTGFVGTSPLHPVWPGEISCRCLGVALEVFDETGRAVRDEEGELVVTQPMPSMPVAFVNDPGDVRYRAAYFDRYPGVWVHGDRATLTSHGSVVISGRSDGTLNRGGVRMGTAEFYNVVEALPKVTDSLVVHLEDPTGGPGELWLFVVAPDVEPSPLLERIRVEVRTRLSPRHVPDHVVVVDAIPRTLTGKKLEVPVKRILAGADPASVASRSSVANPASLDAFVALAGAHRPPAHD